MSPARSRCGAVALLVGAVLSVAACSDAGGEDAPTDPSPAAPTATEPTSAAPGPTPWPEPTRPAAMERQDVEGAAAAAEYFLELFTYVHLTGDFETWAAMSHPECVFCQSVTEEIGDLYADGGYADGPRLHVVESGAMPPDDEYEFYSVRIDADEEMAKRYAADGSVLETSEAAAVRIDLALMWTADGWTVRGVATSSGDGDESVA